MDQLKYPLMDNDAISMEDNIARAQWLMTHPRLTMGPMAAAYEKKWLNWINRKYANVCNSGSSANLLMAATLLESGKLKNKKVIVPSAAWVTTIAPFIQLGFKPIMCEADKFNFGLDVNHLEELLEEHQPGTVILVQVLGVPAEMDEIMRLKEKYGFFLLEDACAAMGSSYHGRKIGTFGDISSMSTYFGHQFSTIEGGMVFTDNKELHLVAFMLRSHGWITGLESEDRARELKKYGIKDIGTGFIFPYAGYNFRLTDDHAFIGLRQLDRMEWIIERRYANHLLYQKLLKNCFDYQAFDKDTIVCSISFCALAVSEDERNFITSELRSNGIETRPFTSGNQGLQPYWFKKYGKFKGPMATRLYKCGFFLPNYPALTDYDIEYICKVAMKAVEKYRLTKRVILINL